MTIAGLWMGAKWLTASRALKVFFLFKIKCGTAWYILKHGDKRNISIIVNNEYFHDVIKVGNYIFWVCRSHFLTGEQLWYCTLATWTPHILESWNKVTLNVHIYFSCWKKTAFLFEQQVALKKFFPTWYRIIRLEEVVAFTAGLMKDPSALILHISKEFTKMNCSYLGQYNRVADEEKEGKLKRFGKTAVNLDFSIWCVLSPEYPGHLFKTLTSLVWSRERRSIWTD